MAEQRLSDRLGGVAVATPVEGYVRPADWLTMPTLADGDQKIVMLVAVYEHDSNFVAFKISGGGYTVDWGDGSAVENVNSNVQAEHNIQWADVASTTLSTRGYRQALVTIEAQSGQTLTSALLSEEHSVPTSYYSQTLDVVCAGSSFTSILFNGASYSASLEKFEFVGASSLTNMASMFFRCHSLESVKISDTSSVTSMVSTFRECYSLETLPLFDTSSVTSMSSTFFTCYSLKKVPLFDTSSVTNMGNMFRVCNSIQSIPLLNASLVTNTSGMLFNCFSLAKAALFGTNTDISYAGCKLSSDELNEIYTNLATATATITVSDNWGAAGSDTTIAEAKGWTVVS